MTRSGPRTGPVGAHLRDQKRGQRWWPGAARALGRRPALWSTAVRQALRLAPTGWWRRWPPLPRPDPAYLRFRLETAYGDAERTPEPGDVVAYLEWCRNRPR